MIPAVGQIWTNRATGTPVEVVAAEGLQVTRRVLREGRRPELRQNMHNFRSLHQYAAASREAFEEARA